MQSPISLMVIMEKIVYRGIFVASNDVNYILQFMPLNLIYSLQILSDITDNLNKAYKFL